MDKTTVTNQHRLASPNRESIETGISITEIPVAMRKPEVVERFQPALVGGGAMIWQITYHECKFEAH
jgi:hypothetical protein